MINDSHSEKRFPFWAMRLLSAVGLLLVIGVAYFFINEMHNGQSGAKLGISIDRAIPVSKYWVWCYLLYFIIIVLPFFLTKTRRELWRTLTAYGITAMITLAFFAFWRTEMIRPEIFSEDISARMLKAIYRHDRPFNCFPSQHVAYSWTAAFVSLKLNRNAGIIILILAALTSAATLLIKQHWFVDVAGGLAVAVLAHFVSLYIFQNKSADNLEKCGE